MSAPVSFHIRQFGPDHTWPNGGWSLYQITGDEIAARIIHNEHGEVVERHSWCGFIGCFETLDDLKDAIEGVLKKHEIASAS